MTFDRIRAFCLPAVAALLILASALAAPVHAAPPRGKLSGTVVDPAGIPQMGASVWVLSEEAQGSPPLCLFTNDRGVFFAESLRPGLYSVHVTLAGFLPAIEGHVRIQSNLTTVLKIALDSLLTSLDRLRRKPGQEAEADDWTWILRTSASTRPILRWAQDEETPDSEQTPGEQAKKNKPHGRVELTSGSRRPGSVSDIADAASTAFAYEQQVGYTNRLLLAGQVSYERSASEGLAVTWLPTDQADGGPETSLVLRQSKLWLDGSTFRGLHMQHRNQLALGQRFRLVYGADYFLVGLGRSASSLRPHGELLFEIAPNWRASLLVASEPGPNADLQATALESSLVQLDSFPVLLLRRGYPVLAGGRHEELAVARSLGTGAKLAVAAFHDDGRHTAVFGVGGVAVPDVFRESFSSVFAYDGGELNSWGMRAVYQQKLGGDTEATVVYAFGSALTAQYPARPAGGVGEVRDALEPCNHHSLAARISTRLPKTRTNLGASYKWVAGQVVSRQDAFGEALYQTEPNLSLSVRQPLPNFLLSGRVEALADFRNLLAQGYVPVRTREGQVLLMPAYRSFRGGFSFQF